MNVALFSFDVRGELTALTPAAQAALLRPTPENRNTAKTWWKQNWFQAATVLWWIGVIGMPFNVFTDPDITWIHVALAWSAAITFTAVWRWRVTHGMAASPGARPQDDASAP